MWSSTTRWLQGDDVKTALAIGIPLGALFTLFAWRISELLSPDAIGMALGMLLGILAGVPTAALILVASRRPEQADDNVRFYGIQGSGRVYLRGDGSDGVYRLETPTYADEVTPYTHVARKVMGLPTLPERQDRNI